MKKLLLDFRGFLFEKSLITLAVAVIMGTVTTALIKALVADILTPLIAAIFGQPHFGGMKFSIHHSDFLYGDLVNVALTFLFTGVAVFFLIVKPQGHFQKDDLSTRSCPACFTSISAKATRCPACTSEVAPTLTA